MKKTSKQPFSGSLLVFFSVAVQQQTLFVIAFYPFTLEGDRVGITEFFAAPIFAASYYIYKLEAG